MQKLLNNLPFDPEWLIALAIASLVLFLLSLIFIPWLITRLPCDYFTDEKRQISKTRNLSGVVFTVFNFYSVANNTLTMRLFY